MTGHLLIAVPELPDRNFFRSVVLVFHHDESGASGVILNRPSEVTLAEVWQEVSDCQCDSQQTVSVGGPVQGPLIALHTSPVQAESEVIPGVYISMSRDQLNAIVTQESHEFKIFSGYAGWGPGQLDDEIEAGGWLTMEANFVHVFESPEELWKKVCEAFGKHIMQAQIGRHVPPDPSLN